MTVYRCQDSLESIFTAIYISYEEKRQAEDTYLALHDEPLLFADNIPVEPDVQKTIKVIRTLRRRFGESDYEAVCRALAAPDPEKAQAVYRTLAGGLASGCPTGHLLDNLADDNVLKVFSLAGNVLREIDHLRGFLRFRELENGMLYAKIGPKNNVLTFLMPHFADRLPEENFVVYDDTRGIFGIHPAGGQWYLLSGEEAEEPVLHLSEEERKYQELFCHFCRTIAIKERKNLKLQQNMLPLRFQGYMVEFQQKA